METVFNTYTPEELHEKALSLGMPEQLWEHMDMNALSAIMTHPCSLVYMNLPMEEPSVPDKQYIDNFHKDVYTYFQRMFPPLPRACYYFPNDPNVFPFVVNNANAFMLYANHHLSKTNEDVKTYSEKRYKLIRTTNQDPNTVVTKRPRGRPAHITEQEHQLREAEKTERSQKYAQWLEDCADYRARVQVAKDRYRDAFATAEVHRLALREIEFEGAPKRPL